MALTLRNLQNLSGSGDSTKVWTYKTGDTKAAVKGANYFDGASGLLSVGDRLMLNCSDADFDAHVSAITAGAVTIAAIDAFI
jgi:hypothetical protein